jgi:putative ABC transport system permease protein
MQDITSDVRHAIRSLTRSPGFAIVAILTLTLGIGANTLLFSVVDHGLFRALPYPSPAELVAVWPNTGMLRGELLIIQRNSRSFTDVGGYVMMDGFNLTAGNSSRRVQGSVILPGLLRVLGVDPVLGRTFAEEETQPGGDEVVLITERLWASEYGTQPDIIGRSIGIDGRQRTVVGVIPTLTFPAPDLDVLVPMVVDPGDHGVFWGWGGHRAIARLAPGVTAQMAQEELRSLGPTLRESNTLWTPAENFRSEAVVTPLHDHIVGDTSVTLYVLFAAVGLVLLVACLNVANLLLARGLARQRDMALRRALGATRRRIVREQLVESLAISLVGCIAALIAAHWALQGLIALMPPEIPRVSEITLDARVMLVGLAFALFAGLLAGSVPAVRGARTDPAATLRESSGGARGGSVQRRRMSNVMVIAQITFAVLLITGAGLLLRSLSALNDVERGFNSEDILTARLNLAGEQFETPEERNRFFENVVEQVQTLPGVTSAALGSRVPFGVSRAGVATFIEGVTEDPNNLPILFQTSITPGYLNTLGIRLIEGRTFTPADREGAPLVALVDELAAGQFWPSESPVGRRIRYPWQGAPWIEIVGVVGGVADQDLAAARDPMFYQPIAQQPPGNVTAVMKTSIGQTGMIASLRASIQRVNSSVPVSRVATMKALVGNSLANARWTAILLAVFAGVTLTLGCVGVYGVVAYAVRARTQEIGVRMALGADASRIRTAVLIDGLKLVAPGLALGLLLAIPGARLIEGLLFGISTLDFATFASVPVVLATAALVAVYVPARRATGVHPVEALRE